MNDQFNAPPQPRMPEPQEWLDWLDFEQEQRVAKRDEVVAGMARWNKEHPDIADGDDETGGAVTETLTIGRTVRQQGERDMATVLAPILEAERTVRGWFAGFQKPLVAPAMALSATLLRFQQRKGWLVRQAQLAEAKRHQEEADKARREAREQMRRNAMSTETQAALERASQTAAAAEKAQRDAAAPPARRSRTRGDYGALANVRTTWRFVVDDFSLIPREFLMLDSSRVDAAKKARNPVTNKPIAEIPGGHWESDESLGLHG